MFRHLSPAINMLIAIAFTYTVNMFCAKFVFFTGIPLWVCLLSIILTACIIIFLFLYLFVTWKFAPKKTFNELVDSATNKLKNKTQVKK